MNKEIKMKEALELSKKGYSYGQIAIEMDEPKSTVGRWIKAKLAENETSETDETPVRTDMGRSETFLKQDGTELLENISNVDQNTSKDVIIPKIQDNSSHVELRKAELEHEYRMTKLKFDQQHYIEEAKSQINSSETERLQEELSTIKEELETLQQMHLKNQKKGDGKLHKRNLLLEEYRLSLAKHINDYLIFENEPCRIEEIEIIEEDVTELKTEIEKWAELNEVDLFISAEMKILNGFILELQQVLNCFEEDEEGEFLLSFNKKWKKKVNDWIETV